MATRTAKYLLVVSVLLFSSLAMAENKQFELLMNCWSAMDGDPKPASVVNLKQDFHVVHVLHFSSRARSSRDTVLGKDNFLVVNRHGAQLLTPASDTRPDLEAKFEFGRPEVDSNRYWMTFIPPGESQKVRYKYFTSSSGIDGEAPGWPFTPGLSKTNDNHFAKYEKGPIKSLDFRQSRDIMAMVIRDRAEKNRRNLEKTKAEMQSSLGFGGKTTRLKGSEADDSRKFTPPVAGKATFAREFEIVEQRIDRALSLVDACSQLGVGTIGSAGRIQKANLEELKRFLDSFKSRTHGSERKGDESVKGVR